MTDKIRVTFGVTKGLKNYSSVRFDASLETEVKVGETVEDAYTRAWAVVDSEIDDKLSVDYE